MRDEHHTLENSRIPAARVAYKTLPDTIEKLQRRLNQLVDFAHTNLLNNGKGMSRLGLSERRRKQLVDIRDSISDAHRNLRLILLSANLLVQLQFVSNRMIRIKVNDFAVVGTGS